MVIFALPCVLSHHSPVLWWLSHGEGWDVVWVNCKNCATTENQGAGVLVISATLGNYRLGFGLLAQTLLLA